MKARESGMPPEDAWSAFFDPAGILAQFLQPNSRETIAEFGSGYGTFALPAAQLTRGAVHAFDIESPLVSLVRQRARDSGLANLRAELRDFVATGTGLPDAGIDHAMLYNILHLEEPLALLREAHRILKPGGHLSIIHWNYDPATPRGPPLAIRPRPGQCRAWAESAGFVFVRDADFSRCAPHHYGLLLQHPARPRATADR
ncbi:MAG TPA: class I SAM-dependent methyltransferase [Opitutus sp.]|nr:class I SAM-dependent methyltransferase [Opitutus sp.]